jgi:hypothetical protein
MDFDEFLKKYNAVEELGKQHAHEIDAGRQRKRQREEERGTHDHTLTASTSAVSDAELSNAELELTEADSAHPAVGSGGTPQDAEDRKALVSALLDYIGQCRSDATDLKAVKQPAPPARPRPQSLTYVVTSPSTEVVEVKTKGVPRAADELSRLGSLVEFDLPTVLISQKIVDALVGKQPKGDARKKDAQDKAQTANHSNANSAQSNALIDEDNLDELLAL